MQGGTVKVVMAVFSARILFCMHCVSKSGFGDTSLLLHSLYLNIQSITELDICMYSVKQVRTCLNIQSVGHCAYSRLSALSKC